MKKQPSCDGSVICDGSARVSKGLSGILNLLVEQY